MAYVNLNGADLAYEIAGEGQPLLFIHGFLGNGTGVFYEAFKRNLAADYRVYSIDMRSHGGSADVRDNVTLQQCARDVVTFAQHFGLDEAVVVGHSMGGYITMAAAIQNPKRFKALALVTPAASKGQPSDDVVDDFMAARADRSLMHERFRPMFVHSVDEAELDLLRESALCMPDDIAEQWVRKEWPNSDITDDIELIHLPVLSLIGAKDSVISPVQQFQDASLMPHAKVVAFAEEGHMLPIERPELAMREIRRFLQDLC